MTGESGGKDSCFLALGWEHPWRGVLESRVSWNQRMTSLNHCCQILIQRVLAAAGLWTMVIALCPLRRDPGADEGNEA